MPYNHDPIEYAFALASGDLRHEFASDYGEAATIGKHLGAIGFRPANDPRADLKWSQRLAARVRRSGGRRIRLKPSLAIYEHGPFGPAALRATKHNDAIEAALDDA
jgi:hypothetical protein